MKTSVQADSLSTILVLQAAQARNEVQFAADRDLLRRVLVEAGSESALLVLFARGIEVFGSADSLLHWLRRPHVMFGKSPLAALADGGRQAVDDELCRIEHGEFT